MPDIDGFLHLLKQEPIESVNINISKVSNRTVITVDVTKRGVVIF